MIILFQVIIGIYFLDIWINYFLVNKFFAPLLNIIFITPLTFGFSFFIAKKDAS